MTLRRRILSVVGAACAAVAIAAPLTAAAASSNGLPLVQAKTLGWSSMSYRPGLIAVGQGGSPYVRSLSWHDWTASSATTKAGQLVRQANPSCTPTYLCPVTKKPVTVYLHDAKTHKGTPYFGKMRWTWRNNRGVTKVAYWLFGYEGGTSPAWISR